MINKLHITIITLTLFMAGCMPALPEAEEFCVESSEIICEHLFDGDCLEEQLGLTASRYETEDECRKEEQKVCDEMRNDKNLEYNESEAFNCIDDMKSQTCSEAMRNDSFSCREVFTEKKPPIEDLSEADDDDDDDNDDNDDNNNDDNDTEA